MIRTKIKLEKEYRFKCNGVVE